MENNLINHQINNEYLLKDSIFRIGRVKSVKGRSVEIIMDKRKNTSHLLYRGDLLKNVSVGSYIKILKGFIKIIGKIEGEYIDEDRYSSQKEYGNKKEKINRILNVSMLGFFEKQKFKRGIKELPLIDNECFLLEREEFNQIHNFIQENDVPISIGALSLEKGQKINIGINSLFASHIGIFGNTGSGKSYTLAKVYRELFKKYKDNNKFKKSSQFFLIDFNGEYIREDVIIENKYKNRYDLSTRRRPSNKFPMTEEHIEDPMFWSVFLTATEKTQTPFLKRTLKKLDVDEQKIEGVIKNIITNEDRKIEKGIIFNFLESIKYFLFSENINISELRSKLNYHSQGNTYYIKTEDNKSIHANNNPDEIISKMKEILGLKNNKLFNIKELSKLKKIHLKIVYYYYDEIVRGFSNQEHLVPLIARLDKRINDLEKVIKVSDNSDNESRNFFTVISFKDVNIDMKKILPLLICKQLYDKQKKEKLNTKSLNLIIDEAHNILSYSSERKSEMWKDYRLETFEEIIKEGRKFGVFLTIASQRPADISSTIISQLHNYFLHRLINDKDILAVEKTISYLDKVSFDLLPILPTGSCILAGLLAQVPVVIDVGVIKTTPKNFAPDNKTIELVKIWDKKTHKKEK